MYDLLIGAACVLIVLGPAVMTAVQKVRSRDMDS